MSIARAEDRGANAVRRFPGVWTFAGSPAGKLSALLAALERRQAIPFSAD
jgi:hypothetical protein